MKIYEACLEYSYDVVDSALFTNYEEAMAWIKLKSHNLCLYHTIVIYRYDTDKKETSGELLPTYKHTLKNKRF